MSAFIKYFADLFNGVYSLLKGMKVTGYYFIRPDKIVTQQYPENRKKLTMYDGYKGEIIMPHNSNNEHKCTGCGICQINCPNGSIEVLTFTEEIDGKSKKVLDKHLYHIDMCTFCGLCVKTCPSNALDYGKAFERAMFNRKLFTKQLNQPGSKLGKEVKE